MTWTGEEQGFPRPVAASWTFAAGGPKRPFWEVAINETRNWIASPPARTVAPSPGNHFPARILPAPAPAGTGTLGRAVGGCAARHHARSRTAHGAVRGRPSGALSHRGAGEHAGRRSATHRLSRNEDRGVGRSRLPRRARGIAGLLAEDVRMCTVSTQHAGS